jgi:hypothetical protein
VLRAEATSGIGRPAPRADSDSKAAAHVHATPKIECWCETLLTRCASLISLPLSHIVVYVETVYPRRAFLLLTTHLRCRYHHEFVRTFSRTLFSPVWLCTAAGLFGNLLLSRSRVEIFVHLLWCARLLPVTHHALGLRFWPGGTFVTLTLDCKQVRNHSTLALYTHIQVHANTQSAHAYVSVSSFMLASRASMFAILPTKKAPTMPEKMIAIPPAATCVPRDGKQGSSQRAAMEGREHRHALENCTFANLVRMPSRGLDFCVQISDAKTLQRSSACCIVLSCLPVQRSRLRGKWHRHHP